MTDTFVPPVPHANEEDGTLNHYSRMNRDEAGFQEGLFKKEPMAKLYVNRVIVLADTLDEVKEVQARLPALFHEFEPVLLHDLIRRDERVEPMRLIYASTEYIQSIQDTLRHFFFLSYSIITKNNEGRWTDVRDATSTRWGRAAPGWHSNPDTITTEQVLNGEVVL